MLELRRWWGMVVCSIEEGVGRDWLGTPHPFYDQHPRRSELRFMPSNDFFLRCMPIDDKCPHEVGETSVWVVVAGGHTDEIP